MQAVGSEGVGEGAGNVQLEAVSEQVQANARARYRVVPMRHGVHEGLEHRALAELGTVGPTRRLPGAHRHVPAYEVQGFGDLSVERPADVAGIGLVVDIGPLTRVADRLQTGMGKPPRRLSGAQQRPGDLPDGSSLPLPTPASKLSPTCRG